MHCSFLAFGLASKNKISPGNIKLSVSTVIPCKRPMSQLFRNFDIIFENDHALTTCMGRGGGV